MLYVKVPGTENSLVLLFFLGLSVRIQNQQENPLIDAPSSVTPMIPEANTWLSLSLFGAHHPLEVIDAARNSCVSCHGKSQVLKHFKCHILKVFERLEK